MTKFAKITIEKDPADHGCPSEWHVRVLVHFDGWRTVATFYGANGRTLAHGFKRAMEDGQVPGWK